MLAEYFLAGIKEQRDESDGRTLLGDNTSGRVVGAVLISFQCDGRLEFNWMDSHIYDMQLTTCTFNSDLRTQFDSPRIFRNVTTAQLVECLYIRLTQHVLRAE